MKMATSMRFETMGMTRFGIPHRVSGVPEKPALIARIASKDVLFECRSFDGFDIAHGGNGHSFVAIGPVLQRSG